MGALITLVDINLVGGVHQLSGALFKAQKKAQPHTQMYVARGYIIIASGQAMGKWSDDQLCTLSAQMFYVLQEKLYQLLFFFFCSRMEQGERFVVGPR